MTLEIAVYNYESAWRAQEAGADRLELCDSPGDGGTTPSVGMIRAVRKLPIKLMVMIRPRGGDFLYSDAEVEIMKTDIEVAKAEGVDGVVFGILTPEGNMDVPRNRLLIELARPMEVTCHRAIDMTVDPVAAVQSCIEAGFDRVLTSGGRPTAIEGLVTIARMVTAAAGKIEIMPGSGVNASNARAIVAERGVHELHFSAGTFREGGMKFRNPAIQGMGSESGKEYTQRTVNQQLIRDVRALFALA